ncbi:MAG: carboxypeptidase regulatory-like domain-containing protein [Myxococcales bacterium]|nr:carboxypeptidase regulatory-like domain-containing protein [Myxococcales bacterium]
MSDPKRKSADSPGKRPTPEAGDAGAKGARVGDAAKNAVRGERFARWAYWLAALVCLVFLAGLMDTRLIPPLTSGPVAPSPPTPVEERDGRLLVLAVDGRGCVKTPVDAGADAGGDRAVDCSSAPPVAGATVRLFLRLGDRYYASGQGTTDEQGTVSLEALPRGATWVLVNAEGFARSSAQLVVEGLEAPEDVRRARVVLEPAQQLTVRVQDEAGNPLPDATVLATGGDPLPHGGLTDKHGKLEFTSLGRAPWTVKASARGYESQTQSGVTGDLMLTLRRLGSLSVKVVDVGGGPAQGADVLISGSGLWPARRARTDALGITRIGGLLSGAYDIRAEKASAVSHTLIGHQVTKGEHAEVTLQLLPGRMVQVVVSGGSEEQSELVQGADVVLTEFGLSSFPIQGTTGSDGSVTLGPIAPGPATVSARATGFVARGGVPVPEQLDGPVKISLLKGATLIGLVKDTNDNPVDGASIEIIGTDIDGMPVAETPQLTAFRDLHFAWALAGPSPLIPAGELGVMPGPIPPIPKDWPPSSAGMVFQDFDQGRQSDYVPWVTGLDGRFRAHPVTPGRVRALVRHPAYVEGISDVVTLGPGGEAEVEVVLKAGGTLEGRLVDKGGFGVSGARIDIMALEGTLERTTVTASDGTFAFAAVPEQILLNVYRPDDFDRVVITKVIEVPEGGKKEIEITLPEEREPIVVRVEAGRGDPVEMAQVSVLSLDPEEPLRATFFSDERGEVKVEDARGLPLEVVVTAPGYARAQVQLKQAAELVSVKLETAVSVIGQVTAVRGRRSVEGANILLISGGEQKGALTDSDGKFRIDNVTPGPGRLVVSHPEFARVERNLSIERTEREDRPVELETVDLSAPGDVEGDVVDTDGEPVAGARVAVDVAPAFLPVGALPPGVAVTDSKGHFVLRGLSAGAVLLEAYAADVGRGQLKTEVSEGDATRGVRIVLNLPVSDTEPAATGSVAVTLGENDTDQGVVVVLVHVAPGSEAERAGLLAGDFVLAVDGVDVTGMVDARRRISGPVRGDVVLEIERNGGPLTLRVRRERVRR